MYTSPGLEWSNARLTDFWNRDSLSINGMNCLGYVVLLRGNRRVPEPPARMMEYIFFYLLGRQMYNEFWDSTLAKDFSVIMGGSGRL